MNARKREQQRAARICHLIEQAHAAERDLLPALWIKLLRDLARVPHVWNAFGDIAVSYEFYEKLVNYHRDIWPPGFSFNGLSGLVLLGKQIVPVVPLTQAGE